MIQFKQAKNKLSLQKQKTASCNQFIQFVFRNLYIFLYLMKPGFLLRESSGKGKSQESAQEKRGERMPRAMNKANQANNPEAHRKKDMHEAQTVLDSYEEHVRFEQETLHFMQQQEAKFLLDEVLQHIYDVADRNEVYRCNFVHLLIPLGITLKMLDVGSDRQRETYLRSALKAIVMKLKQKPQLRLQLSRQEQFDQFMILAASPIVAERKLLEFLRKFLELNKEVMVALLPYYYNFFALAVNKEVVFRGEQAQLLEYSVDLIHQQPYGGAFTRKEVCEKIQELEKLLVEKYHSKDI